MNIQILKSGKIALLILLALALGSCNNEEEFLIHESGLQYLVAYKSNSGVKANKSDLLVLDLKYFVDDSCLFNTQDVDREFKMQMKEASHSGGSIEDAFSIMEKGDSLIANIDAIAFFTETRKMPKPTYISYGDKLRFEIKVKDIVNIEDHFEEVRGIKIADEKSEMKFLDDYLKLTNTTVEPTNSGLYYIILKDGTGASPELGDKLKVHYTGTFASGKPFSSSYQTGAPFEFVFTASDLIAGWVEGLTLMREGGRARLIIPSHLAYGAQGKRPQIPPYSTLVFEMDLISVEKSKK